jgi:hypothetical protein
MTHPDIERLLKHKILSGKLRFLNREMTLARIMFEDARNKEDPAMNRYRIKFEKARTAYESYRTGGYRRGMGEL